MLLNQKRIHYLMVHSPGRKLLYSLPDKKEPDEIDFIINTSITKNLNLLPMQIT
jgi:hypothetical protein